MMVVHMISPDGSRDQLYIGNYVYLNLRDVIARVDGVGDAQVFGGRACEVVSNAGQRRWRLRGDNNRRVVGR
jgi:multidrug efflux pump subunit AcrB